MRDAVLAALLWCGSSAPAWSEVAGHGGTSSSCPPAPRLVGVHRVPAGTVGGADAFGGISGLDYDASRRRWWLVSDDRGERGPPRLFAASLRLGPQGIGRFTLVGSRHLAGDGTPATPRSIDAEALRMDRNGELLVASEGDAGLGIGHWIRRYRRDGRLAGELSLPAPLRMDDAAVPAATPGTGPRANRSLEGLALTPDGRRLWIALEAPLLQDGQVATAAAGANLRLTRVRIDARDAGPRGAGGFQQFVYAADAALGHAAGESSDNGISEILGVDADTLLVLERSGRQHRDGSFDFRTRLYCAEIADATDVAPLRSLEGAAWRPMRKRLLLDFSSLPDGGQNFEAMAWGPSAGRGHRWLLVASDNNFFPGVPTVLLAFEMRTAAR